MFLGGVALPPVGQKREKAKFRCIQISYEFLCSIEVPPEKVTGLRFWWKRHARSVKHYFLINSNLITKFLRDKPLDETPGERNGLRICCTIRGPPPMWNGRFSHLLISARNSEKINSEEMTWKIMSSEAIEWARKSEAIDECLTKLISKQDRSNNMYGHRCT